MLQLTIYVYILMGIYYVVCTITGTEIMLKWWTFNFKKVWGLKPTPLNIFYIFPICTTDKIIIEII